MTSFPRARRAVSVAFPDTILEERHDSLREKTTKLGQIARTCSVFGVDTIQVFRDPRGGGESALIKSVLQYLETPQYLRKRLFGIDESLKYAGLLPPLRSPSHKPKVRLEELGPGEVREGFVLSDGRTVDVGLDGPVSLRNRVEANKRVTVKLTSTQPLEGVLLERGQVGAYWGYTVEVRDVKQVLSDPRFRLKVATSRLGSPLSSFLAEMLSPTRPPPSDLVLIFGSPSRGLFEMIEGLDQKVSFVVNLYPEQHTITVRTEEAISSALYLFEIIDVLKYESLKANEKSG